MPAFIALTVLFSINFVYATTTLNVSMVEKVQPSSNISITGTISNTSSSDTISGINVSASVTSGGNGYNITPSNGFFNFNVSAPNSPGQYSVIITTNESSPHTKNFTVYVANSTTGSVSYINTFPPYANGTTFTVNLTLNNGSAALNGYLPNISVYSANGALVNWTVQNLSASSNSSGNILYNVTIPASASFGNYVIVVDGGSAFSVFQVSSNMVNAVQTWDSSDAVTSGFSPSSTVNIVSKLRDSSGNPLIGATVTAFVTLPNNTVRNFTLSSHPTLSGVYNNTFSETSASGSYQILVSANASGTVLTSNTVFTVGMFSASIQPVKSFFFEWGGQGAFKPNSTFAFDIVPINLTDGSTLTANSCPAANYTLLDVSLVGGSSILSQIMNYSFVLDAQPSGNVCSIKFGNATIPSNITNAGTYSVKANVSLAGEFHNVTGFFSIQNYFLKVVPVMSLGGQDSFEQVAAPGSNLTINLKAINVSTGETLLPQNITSFSATSIIPLQFTGGTNQTTNISQTSVSGTNPNTDPTINLVLPSSMMGPLLIKIQATVAGQTITGNVFIIANYLMGGISPQGIVVGGGPGSGGGGGPGGGGPSGGDASGSGQGMLCSGTQTFTGSVQDAATSNAAQGATVVGILQAREDQTGKDVSSLLSVSGSTASTSSGTLTVNVTFNPGAYSFSGGYFAILNATYKNVSAGIPGFFQCKNLNIGFPQISTIGSTSNVGYFVSPNSGLNVSLNNVSNMTGSLINTSSSLYITQIFNFNPGSGSMRILVNNTPLVANFANVSGTIAASLSIYPQNFSLAGSPLTQWPSGFFDVRPTVRAIVTGATSFVTDTAHGGFSVVPFNAFPESFGFGSVSVGSTVSTVIDIQANGTYNNAAADWSANFYSGPNNTLVNISIGRPWEGSLVQLTGVNATLLSDGWNKSSDSFNYGTPGGPFERWNLTYTLPTTVKKGFAMVTITVNATTNGVTGFGTVQVPLGFSVSKYNVVIPSQEGVGDSFGGSPFDGYGISFNNTPNNVSLPQFGGWNASALFSTYGLNSSIGRVCVKNSFNSSRYGNGPLQQMSINSTSHVMVLDAHASGVYDTIVVNNSDGRIIILNSTQRNYTVANGQGGIYFWQIDNCGYFTVVNTTAASIAPQGSFVQSYGGSHQINTNFSIPYVISLGSPSSPLFQSGNGVGIKGLGLQNPGRNGGFGFQSKLTAGTDYTATGGSTDANGVAFVILNVSRTGNFVGFWNVTIGTDTDAADFSSATFFDARAFNAYTNIINSSAVYQVVLLNNVGGGGDGNYTGNNGNLFVEYNLASQKFKMNFNSPSPGQMQNVNQSFNLNGNNYNVAWITGNVSSGGTSSNNQTMLLYKSDNFQTGVVSVTSATQNITLSVCGFTFGGNPPSPIPTMTLNNITAQDWSRGGGVDILTIYELMNNTNVTSTGVGAGPSGCILVNVAPGQLTSWPSASSFAPPVFANAYVTNSTNSQQIYATNIFKTG